MDIKKTGINYRFEADGITVQRVDMSYSGFESAGDSVTVTSTITKDMLEDGTTFDDMTPKMLDELGRAKVATWFAPAEATTVATTPVTNTDTTDPTGDTTAVDETTPTDEAAKD